MEINIRKKEADGSYSSSPYLFDAVDLYNGDTVKSILELSPAVTSVKNVKLTIVCDRNDVEYEFKPVQDDEYELTTDRYKGLVIWFADSNGVKFKPDQNGVVSITNLLAVPLDIQVWLKAKPYTVQKLNESLVLDDIKLVTWYQNA